MYLAGTHRSVGRGWPYRPLPTRIPVGHIRGRITLDGNASGNLGFIVFIAGTSFMAVTDDAGNFSIIDVPVGSDYLIVVMKGDKTRKVQVADVTAGETTTVESIDLTAGGGITDSQASIIWKGTEPSHPSEPKINWAYYNSSDSISYIYDGTRWQILAKDGQDGAAESAIAWQGSLESAPETPQLNWAYYNSTDGISYIYDGRSWQILAVNIR